MIWAWLSMASMVCAVVVLRPLLQVPSRGRRWLAMMAVVLLVIALPAGLYYLRGSWQELHEQRAATAQLRHLERRVAEHPDDVNGWLALGRAHLEQGSLPQAKAALQQASRLAPDDLDVRSAQALALALERGSFQGEASALLDEVLRKNPDHREALWLAALAARERDDVAATRDYLQRLQALLQPQDPMTAVLQRALAQLPAQEQTTPEVLARVTVQLPKGSPAAAYAGHRVVVFARKPEQAMPLAATTMTVARWPVQVTLQRSHALGALDDRPVTLVARLAAPDEPLSAPGLLEGSLENIRLPHSSPLLIELEPLAAAPRPASSSKPEP